MRETKPGRPAEAAFSGIASGHGAVVRVEDLDTGVVHVYTLMTGADLDLAAGHVSLASPIGRALAGRGPGAVVVVETPRRPRRLRVLEVTGTTPAVPGTARSAAGTAP